MREYDVYRECGNGDYKIIYKENRLLVRYKGRTVEGSLTEDRIYEAAYFTYVYKDGHEQTRDYYSVQDDTGWYCPMYSEDWFEIIWTAKDGTEKPCEGYFPEGGRW